MFVRAEQDPASFFPVTLQEEVQSCFTCCNRRWRSEPRTGDPPECFYAPRKRCSCLRRCARAVPPCSVFRRMEAVYIRDEMLKLHTKTGSLRRPLEVVRFLEDEISKGEKKLVRFPDFCLHTAYKFCNRTQYPCAGILLRQATGFDGHPAASNSAMPCPGARPALADRAPPSMPEIATGLAPKGTVHCAYMISAVTVGAKCNSC